MEISQDRDERQEKGVVAGERKNPSLEKEVFEKSRYGVSVGSLEVGGE